MLIILFFLGELVRANADSVFFSAYIEGSGNNKAFGIYNPTGASLLLSNFAILNCFNGCGTSGTYEHWVPFAANASVASGAEYVVCDKQVAPAIFGSVPCQESRQFMPNGDDSLQLVECGPECHGKCVEGCGGWLVTDSIGNFTSDPEPWEVCGVRAATKDHSLFRAPFVCSGNGGDWSASSLSVNGSCEWEVLPKNGGVVEHLGFHATSGCVDDGGRATRAPSLPPALNPTPAPSLPRAPLAPATMCSESPLDDGETRTDRRSDPTRLRVAQWNAEWLFSPRVKSSGAVQCPCMSAATCVGGGETCDSGCCPWGRLDADAHLRYVATEVSRLDADILHLVEVGDCAVLRELLTLLPDGHGYKPFMVGNDDSATGQHVGLLSRVDPLKDLEHFSHLKAPFPVASPLAPTPFSSSSSSLSSASSSSFTVVASASACAVASDMQGLQGLSKHLVARFPSVTGDGRALTLVGVHFLAIPDGTQRCARREAQALVAAQLASQALTRGDHVVLLGDMNDFDAEAVGSSGIGPVTNALAILRNATNAVVHGEGGGGGEDGSVKEERKDGKWGGGARVVMRNAVELLPPHERFSEWWDQNGDCVDGGSSGVASQNERSMLDHILLSSSSVGSGSLWERVGVERDQGVSRKAAVRMWHDWDAACETRGGLYSDHWPLSVDLLLSPSNNEGSKKNESSSSSSSSSSSACESTVAKLEASQAKVVTVSVIAAVLVLVLICACRAQRKAGSDGKSFFSSKRRQHDVVSGVDDDTEDAQVGIGMSPIHSRLPAPRSSTQAAASHPLHKQREGSDEEN